jgi:hypothetical protein
LSFWGHRSARETAVYYDFSTGVILALHFGVAGELLLKSALTA